MNIDYKTIKQKSLEEVETLFRDGQAELHHLRFKASEGQLKHVRSIRATRRSIARLLTYLKTQIQKVENIRI